MFNSARRKLTAWYILILMSVSLAFSIVIYRGMSIEVERFAQLQRMRFERRFDELGIPRPIIIEGEIISEMKQHIIMVLLGINGGIFIIFGGLAYLLAGKTLSPIQDMIEEQNRFISDASHELKTPLTAMKSSLEVYVRDPKLKLSEAKQVLRDNIDEVNRLQRLSESLLTLSENQIGNVYNLSLVNFHKVVLKASEQVKHFALTKNITISSTLTPKVTVKGNEEKLIELVTILLDNAIKYSPNDSVVTLTGKIAKKYFILTIADNGIGIDTKDIPHIFDRFYRSDSARSQAGVGGYGLGLSIAKKIVDLHSGSIKIQSKIHKGASVIVSLPL